jgi:hypothetical protein
MRKSWGIKVKADIPESTYFEMMKKVRKQGMTINKYITTLIVKDLGIDVKAKLLPEEREEFESSIRNSVNAEVRKQATLKSVIIARKKLSGIHAKKETNTENESNNLFTRATKGDF